MHSCRVTHTHCIRTRECEILKCASWISSWPLMLPAWCCTVSQRTNMSFWPAASLLAARMGYSGVCWRLQALLWNIVHALMFSSPFAWAHILLHSSWAWVWQVRSRFISHIHTHEDGILFASCTYMHEVRMCVVCIKFMCPSCKSFPD